MIGAVLLGSLLLAAPGGVEGDDVPLARRSDPDPVYFEDRIQPLLMSRCAFAGCHGDAGAGRLVLQRPDFTGRMTPERTAHNLATTLPFVAFGAPLESRLILKPLIKRDGGLPHSGDEYDFRKGSEEFALLSEWVRGVELEDVPPIAVAGDDLQAKVGQEVRLDGGGSRERRGRVLAYAWSIASMPEGATPLLKGADTATPTFRGDRDGAYALSLVVDNGERESEPSTVTVSIDSLPFVSLPAEAAFDRPGFYVEADPAAAGGQALRVGQEVESLGEVVARFHVTLPEGGPYRLFARVRGSGVGDAADAAPLRFRIGDGPALELAAPLDGSAYRMLPVVGPEVRPLLREAGGEVLAGSAETASGQLRLRGSVARPAVFSFRGAVAEGSLAARVRIDRPAAGSASDAVAGLLFGVRDARNAWFAGIHFGRQRFVIGRVVDGALEVDAERRHPVRPEADYALSVEFRGDRAWLFPGDEPVLEARLPGPVAEGALGLLATVSAGFDDARARSGDRELMALDFAADAQPAGFLARGDHVLTVTADAITAPALDELFLARADFATAVDDRARREVRAVYLDLLGRVPTPVELMMAAGVDRGALLDRLVGSLEFYENLYELELYYFLLLDNFRPRTPQMDSIPARLMNRRVHLRDAIQEIVISQYFNARNPGNDTFVSVVFEQLLGITVQDEPRLLEAGKAMYDGAKTRIFGREGDRQSDIVTIVVAEDRFAPSLLARHYERVLGRAPDPRDLERWAAAFRDDPYAYESIVKEWLRSPAYDEALATLRPKTDHMWIRSLFVDLLERRPDFDEYRNFRNAVQALSDSSPVRSVLSRVIVDSGRASLPAFQAADPRGFVTECFLRYLGRAPSGKEADAFAAALTGPGGRPELLVAAILTSAEYQHY